MQDKDWIVRNDNVWVKPNPIPDQVADRSSMSHEYVFHFVTQRFYYYNRIAVGRKSTRGTYMPPTDTWDVPISKGGTLHKASFSEELVKFRSSQPRHLEVLFLTRLQATALHFFLPNGMACVRSA